MRRVTLLALLALALPTAALAAGIDFTTGNFESGTFTGSFTSSIGVTVAGSSDTITIDTGTLTLLSTGACPLNIGPGTLCYSFMSGGNVSVMSRGSTVFTDTLVGGLVTVNGATGIVTITAGLTPDNMVGSGTIAGSSFVLSSGTIKAGSSNINGASPTPEPGTLGMLGTGLIGLAGLARRKLKFWT